MKPTVVYPDADEDTAALVSGPLGERLRAAADTTIYKGRPDDDAHYILRVGDARGLMLGWGLPLSVMQALPALEVISFTGIGVGNFVDIERAAAQGITVCNCPGYADNTVAEHALALLLATARHVVHLDRDLRAGQWNQSSTGTELRGKRLGLVGLGGIGARMAELGVALGMEVTAWTRHPSVERAAAHGLEFMPLDELLESADVVSIHAALTPETSRLLDARRIGLLHPEAIIINTARGEIVDEDALVEALRSERIRGAGLDVFNDDPLPAGHPLFALDNVVLSPHVAFKTPDAHRMICQIAVDNLVAYFDGEPINVVAAPQGASGF